MPFYAPGIRIPPLTGGARKKNLILQGLPWCSVSPFTVGVIHAISLIFLCGKDTKRQDTREYPGISNISSVRYLYVTEGFPLAFIM